MAETRTATLPPPEGVLKKDDKPVVSKQKPRRPRTTDVEPGTPFDRPRRNRRGELVLISGKVQPHPPSE